MEIQSIKINANSNATESLSKLKACFSYIIPSLNDSDIETHSVLGGYANPITTLEYNSTKSSSNLSILHNIISKISIQDKIQIGEELERRTNSKGILHLRFSKRELAQQNLVISSQSDSFRVLIKFTQLTHRFDIKKNFNELKEFLNTLGLIE